MFDHNNFTVYKTLLSHAGGIVSQEGNTNIAMAKIFTLISEARKENIKELMRLLDIDQCVGQELDDFGVNKGVPRQGRDDETYRAWIKTYSNVTRETCDRDMLTYSISLGLGIDPSDFVLYETQVFEMTPTCILELEIRVPYDEDRLKTVMELIKASGVGFRLVVRGNPILGDDGKFYLIYHRFDAGLNPNKLGYEGHIIAATSIGPTQDIIINKENTTENFRIKVSTNKRLYLESTLDAVTNNTFTTYDGIDYEVLTVDGIRINWRMI